MNFSLILFASFDPIVVKYSFIIVAMDCWSLTGTSSEIMHDGVVLDLSRAVISFPKASGIVFVNIDKILIVVGFT